MKAENISRSIKNTGENRAVFFVNGEFSTIRATGRKFEAASTFSFHEFMGVYTPDCDPLHILEDAVFMLNRSIKS